MPHSDPLREGERILTICNACRYCEGYCAVFPAMERLTDFARADLHYLANLCHQCGECYYACPYAPPHEFGVNVPQTLAKIRVESYRAYAWPASAHRVIIFAAVLAAGLIAVLRGWNTAEPVRGAFYDVVPYQAMVSAFAIVSAFIALALFAGLVRFWREPAPSLAALRGGMRDALTLKYLASRDSRSRQRFHHCTSYGFLLCFASTSVAAFYHHALGSPAPYGYLSLPVVLGTAGGLGLLIGPAGLYWLKRTQDRATADADARGMEVTFLALLFFTSLTGLALLAFRNTAAMPPLLYVHLGIVLALLLTLPYGKFVHAIYRAAALVRYAVEQSNASKLKNG